MCDQLFDMRCRAGTGAGTRCRPNMARDMHAIDRRLASDLDAKLRALGSRIRLRFRCVGVVDGAQRPALYRLARAGSRQRRGVRIACGPVRAPS